MLGVAANTVAQEMMHSNVTAPVYDWSETEFGLGSTAFEQRSVAVCSPLVLPNSAHLSRVVAKQLDGKKSSKRIGQSNFAFVRLPERGIHRHPKGVRLRIKRL